MGIRSGAPTSSATAGVLREISGNGHPRMGIGSMFDEDRVSGSWGRANKDTGCRGT